MSEQQIKSYRDLRVWREAMDLVEQCYKMTALFPTDEKYGLTSQLRRAAVSVPANIAEGYGRDNTGTYIQFLKIAQGSLKEVETLMMIAERVVSLATDVSARVLARCDTVGKMLAGLIRAVRAEDG